MIALPITRLPEKHTTHCVQFLILRLLATSWSCSHRTAALLEIPFCFGGPGFLLFFAAGIEVPRLLCFLFLLGWRIGLVDRHRWKAQNIRHSSIWRDGLTFDSLDDVLGLCEEVVEPVVLVLIQLIFNSSLNFLQKHLACKVDVGHGVSLRDGVVFSHRW